MKKRYWLLLMLLGILIIGVGAFLFYQEQQQKLKQEQEEKKQQELLVDIKNHYATRVRVIKDTNLYKYEQEKYQEAGKINTGVILFLEEVGEQTLTSEYFKIKDSDYYLYYDSVEKTEEIIDTRYHNYIPFPLEITTIENTTFYNKEGQEAFTLQEEQITNVIEKTATRMGIELFDQLVYIDNTAVKSTTELESSEEKADAIATILYHFIYLNGDTSCQETICHSEEQITSHFAYIQQEGYFTMTTTEMLRFIQGEIQLPKKSLLITIDDGARAEKFIPFLEQYNLRATLFLVSSWYSKETFASPNLEIASHTHDMHTTGVCPTGQGGGINCLEEEKILTDLKASRDTLDETIAMAFPFFEYSDYAINLVKQAGFQIAFIGGQKKVTRGINPYKTPRYTMFYSTSVEQLANIISP